MMLRNLLSGLRIALLLSPSRHGLHVSWSAFWAIAGLILLALFSLDLWLTPPPLLFQVQALTSLSLSLILTLLAAFLTAQLFHDDQLPLELAILFLNMTFWVQLISQAVLGGLLREQLQAEPSLHWALYYLSILWYLLATIRCLAFLTVPLPFRRLGASALLVALIMGPPWIMELPRFWERDYYQLYQQAEANDQTPKLDAERLLSRQWPTLEAQWRELLPSSPGKSDLYFVGFAGHGKQNVFRNEVEHSQRLFDERFGTQGRSLTLINSPATADLLPLASATNLEATLQQLDRLIQPEEDILFLFLTSHGSEDHYLSVNLPPLPLNDLGAAHLGKLLAESRFKWKVILVSACYSGGFIEQLASPTTLVMTAARADRTSFGCSDDAEFTYFGRAYFVEALATTHDFIEAFTLAQAKVKEWETRDAFTPSEPQISIGAEIEQKLRKRAQTLASQR